MIWPAQTNTYFDFFSRASAQPYYFNPAYNLVCYPNRDSTPFKEFYGLKDVQNLCRGSMRYGGFCEVVIVWREMGFIDDTQQEYLQRGAPSMTWIQLTAKLLGVEPTEAAVLAKLKTLKSIPSNQYTLITSKLRSLGLFSSERVSPRGSVMRTLSALLEEKCQFQPGEVDIVLLQHTFEIVWPDGKTETRKSTLEAYGDRNGGPSAMARLVGVPCGMAVQFVLAGKLNKPGVHAPYDEEVSVEFVCLFVNDANAKQTCAMFRDRLEKEEGISMIEKTV